MRERLALMGDDTIKPIETFIAPGGAITDDPDRAVVGIVKNAEDSWVVIDLRKFENATIN
jgi:hypothetical protein